MLYSSFGYYLIGESYPDLSLNDSYQAYVNRAVGFTRPEHYQQQLQNIHSSPKYQKGATGDWEAVPFPGYTLIAPTSGEDPVNQPFYEALQQAQAQLGEMFPTDFFVPIQDSSLHLTVADLLWADAFVQAEKLPDFQDTLHREMAGVFKRYDDTKHSPLRFQALGYMVMPRALSICLVPDTETTFQRLMDLRRAIYQTEALLGLGIEQHYNTTLHITLGYFGILPDDLDRAALAERMTKLNQSAIVTLPEFVVQRAELRRFDDMNTYRREPGWPVLEF